MLKLDRGRPMRRPKFAPTGMYQICEACGEYEFVEGYVYDSGDNDYEIEISDGFAPWTDCPACGLTLDGDTEGAELSWSIYEPGSLP